MRRVLLRRAATPQVHRVVHPTAEGVVAAVVRVVPAALADTEGVARIAELEQWELKLSRGHAGTSLGVHGVRLPSSLR